MSRSFPGTAGNNIVVPYNAAFDIGKPLTMSIWINPSSLASGTQRYLSRCKSSANAGGYELMVDTSTLKLQAHVVAATFPGQALSSVANVVTGAWQHAGMVVDASTLAVFLNGVKASAALGTNPATNNTYGLGIGRYPDTTASGLVPGLLAEAAIWNVALTDAEMAALAKGVLPPLIRRSALVVYYPLWGIGSSEPDLGGLALNGTITGSVPQGAHAPVGRVAAFAG